MGVVLGESPHPHQSMQHAAAFVPVNRPQFSDAHGQFPVAAQGGPVHHYVEGTVHWLQEILLFVHFQGGIHAVPVVGQVTAGLPQLGPAYMRRINDTIIVAVVDVPPVVFHQAAHHAALRVPDNQSRSDFFMYGVQPQLAAQSSVVAPIRLLQPVQVVIQGILAFPGRPVYALQHGTVLVPPPVSARDVQQLNRLNVRGAVHVRPLAQVNKLSVPVYAQGRLVRQVADNFQLVGLIGK